MHVLVATRDLQCTAPDDFFWGVEGELVSFPTECSRPQDCGCGRSFAGLSSKRATTTARVEEIDLTMGAYVQLLVADALNDVASIELDSDEAEAVRQAAELAAEELGRVAATFACGTVVARCENWILVREGVAER